MNKLFAIWLTAITLYLGYGYYRWNELISSSLYKGGLLTYTNEYTDKNCHTDSSNPTVSYCNLPGTVTMPNNYEIEWYKSSATTP